MISSDPKIMMGKPTIVGTRITVELILEKLAAGETVDQILSEHPRLTAEAIRAAITFAAEALRADVIYPAEKVTDRRSSRTKTSTSRLSIGSAPMGTMSCILSKLAPEYRR